MPFPLLIPALIAGGATLLSGIIQGSAAQQASATQAGAAQAGIDEQRRQFEAMQATLSPYVRSGQDAIAGLAPYSAAGTQALAGQMNLAGLNGANAQQSAIDAIGNSAEMRSLTEQGENAILQRAAATGGLRGGNVQGALAQFRPQLLSNLINQQYSRLGGLTSLGQSTTMNIANLGQASAAGVGSAGMQSGANIANLLATQGAANAGGQLAAGQAWNSVPNAVMAGLGMYRGLGGF